MHAHSFVRARAAPTAKRIHAGPLLRDALIRDHVGAVVPGDGNMQVAREAHQSAPAAVAMRTLRRHVPQLRRPVLRNRVAALEAPNDEPRPEQAKVALLVDQRHGFVRDLPNRRS